MKILWISPRGDGLWYVLLLQRQGHKVTNYIHDEKYKGTFAGIVDLVDKLPNPAPYDLVVFDSDGLGDMADKCRERTPTVGSSSLADRLEEDRLFGLELMERAGIRVPTWEAFDSPEKGIAWLEKTNKKTVFKPIGEVEDKSTTYVSKGRDDMISFMERVFSKAKINSFVLQEVIEGGTETACGGWFNGHDWLVIDHNIEEKKLMPGNLGPNTGCASMLMWLPSKPTPLYEQGLGKVTEFLREQNYVGPLDLNTICTEGTAYGIEWTPRFGYEGTCNLTQLISAPFGELLVASATGSNLTLGEPKARFAATIRLSTPPYPNADATRKRFVVPVNGINLEDIEKIFLGDLRLNGEQLETTGWYNMVAAPIGLGNSIGEAFAQSEAMVKSIEVPDAMWRNDVCKCTEAKYDALQRMGWIKAVGEHF